MLLHISAAAAVLMMKVVLTNLPNRISTNCYRVGSEYCGRTDVKKAVGKVLTVVGVSIALSSIIWAVVSGFVPSGLPLDLLCELTALLGTGYLVTILGINMCQKEGSAYSRKLERVHRTVGTAVIVAVIIVCTGSFLWSALARGSLSMEEYMSLEDDTVAWLIAGTAPGSRTIYVGRSEGRLAPSQIAELNRRFPGIDIQPLEVQDSHYADSSEGGLNRIVLRSVSFRALGIARVDVSALGCAGFVDAYYFFGNWREMGRRVTCPLLHYSER